MTSNTKRDGDSTTLLALAGGGLLLWLLLRGRNGPPSVRAEGGTSAGVNSSARSEGATKSQDTPRVRTRQPCRVRVVEDGIMVDGGPPVDIPTAVARCQPAGSADVVITGNANYGAATDLKAALRAAGIVLSVKESQ